MLAEFQSTPSARRATCPSWAAVRVPKNFNPRPPRGERPCKMQCAVLVGCISIHALREESDCRLLCCSDAQFYFNPRPPRGERPVNCTAANAICDDFNPRPPRGERPGPCSPACSRTRFQSTPSARRATSAGAKVPAFFYISIHALREESDLYPHTGHSYQPGYFNPRPPRGERPF